ncbi:hypothetical protein E1162_17000 [Rhodobacteraceae bacterium RKSG542]|uniref:helix-turn-helix domain-containing protein n=1 Tax=Pseudovibrio flavus TaxID=2529854 RepID=UPI0012BBA9FE|nr:helix-turn-helix domain-containing protein [Pseudovibrio flavus]MTI18944.1 hypothetical protein [Pseudovibrio flavus]
MGGVDFIATGCVALAFAVNPRHMHAPSRGRARVALARQVSMYLLHVALGLTLSQAGRVFGRDRTTAGHACKIVEDMRDDETFDRLITDLEAEMQASVRRAIDMHEWRESA